MPDLRPREILFESLMTKNFGTVSLNEDDGVSVRDTAGDVMLAGYLIVFKKSLRLRVLDW